MKRCLCGRTSSYCDSGAELVAISAGTEWEAFWPSIVGPDDFYCSEDDDVLTGDEAAAIWAAGLLQGDARALYRTRAGGTSSAESEPGDGDCSSLDWELHL